MIELEIQRIIFGLVKNAKIKELIHHGKLHFFDYRDQTELGDDNEFPFAVFGNDTFQQTDTDTTSGVTGTVPITVLSRQKTFEEIKVISSKLKRALHLMSPTSPLIQFMTIEVDTIEFFNEPESKQMRAEIKLKVIADEEL